MQLSVEYTGNGKPAWFQSVPLLPVISGDLSKNAQTGSAKYPNRTRQVAPCSATVSGKGGCRAVRIHEPLSFYPCVPAAHRDNTEGIFLKSLTEKRMRIGQSSRMQENCFRLIDPVISCILVGYYVQIIHQKTQTKVWVLFLFFERFVADNTRDRL